MKHILTIGLATMAMAAVPVSAAELFRATISPVTEAQHGQWNVALTELAPGRVMAIWEAGHTEAKTPNVIMAAVSEDGGRSWSERREFIQREAMRCTPCGFYRMKGLLHCVHGELPMAGGKQPCRVMLRTSADNGATWSEAREIWQTEMGMAMQPVVLRDGRIALPVYRRGKDAQERVTSVSEILVSQDDGATWLAGGMIPVDLPGGAMEPALVETASGEWLCVIRTRGTGWLHAARSNDGGQTWAPPEPLPLESPESIARLLRLADSSIIVVWNGVASKTQGPRDRLTVARSLDGGRTWPQRRDVVQGGPVFSNHGVTQTSDGRVLIGYQDFHRDPERAPERSGVDSVELAGLDLSWLDRSAK